MPSSRTQAGTSERAARLHAASAPGNPDRPRSVAAVAQARRYRPRQNNPGSQRRAGRPSRRYAKPRWARPRRQPPRRHWLLLHFATTAPWHVPAQVAGALRRAAGRRARRSADWPSSRILPWPPSAAIRGRRGARCECGTSPAAGAPPGRRETDPSRGASDRSPQRRNCGVRERHGEAGRAPTDE